MSDSYKRLNLNNSLSEDQKRELLIKIELLMTIYKVEFNCHENMYFAGFIQGLNSVCKMIEETVDDYCILSDNQTKYVPPSLIVEENYEK